MKRSSMFLAIVSALAPSAVAAVSSCEDLAKLSLPQTEITLVQTVPAGAFTPPQAPNGRGPDPVFRTLPVFCRVAATLRPSSESIIKIEVWLPESGWNGRLEVVGNGGWGGTINYPNLGQELAAGYVVAGSDTGHDTNNSEFTFGHRERLIDFSYRAVHETALKAKRIVETRYGNGPRFSYFNGCSTGGRQALNAAQRFPEDFNGVIAGAAANPLTRLHAGSMWNTRAAHKEPGSYIPPEKYEPIHKAVVEACDRLDGLKDGLIGDPTKCTFDPKQLLCKDGDANTCLTAPQVESLRAAYSGAVNPRTDEQIFPGWERGFELGLRVTEGPKPENNAIDTFRAVLQKPDWDWQTLDFDRDIALTDKLGADTVNASDPAKMKDFFARGGKLFLFHGWSDPNIAPRNSVNYYEKILDTVGGAQASGSIRLFMLPGMGHCGGGEGPNTFDRMAVITQWVEQGKAPERINASHSTGANVDRTRPLCPYPQTAQYNGSGSIDEAANFTCKAPGN